METFFTRYVYRSRCYILRAKNILHTYIIQMGLFLFCINRAFMNNTVWTINDVRENLYPFGEIYTYLLSFCAIKSIDFPKRIQIS